MCSSVKASGLSWTALPLLLALSAAAAAQEAVAPAAEPAPAPLGEQVIEFSADLVTYDSRADIVTATGRGYQFVVDPQPFTSATVTAPASSAEATERGAAPDAAEPKTPSAVPVEAPARSRWRALTAAAGVLALAIAAIAYLNRGPADAVATDPCPPPAADAGAVTTKAGTPGEGAGLREVVRCGGRVRPAGGCRQPARR